MHENININGIQKGSQVETNNVDEWSLNPEVGQDMSGLFVVTTTSCGSFICVYLYIHIINKYITYMIRLNQPC